MRRLKPDIYDSAETAKEEAYKIYSKEMIRIKKAVDSLVID